MPSSPILQASRLLRRGLPEASIASARGRFSHRAALHLSRTCFSDCCSARLTLSQRFHATGSINFTIALPDAVAQIVRVHRVQFPATIPVVGDEPLVTRVLLLIRRRERRQPTSPVLASAQFALRDMIAAVFSSRWVSRAPTCSCRSGRSRRHRARSPSTIVVLRDIVDDGGAAEAVHHPEADRVLIEHGWSTPRIVPFSLHTSTRSGCWFQKSRR